MQRRTGGNVKLNIFQKVILSFQNKQLDRKIKRIKKIHDVDLSESEGLVVKKEFASKKEYKDYKKEISKVLGRNNYRFKKVKSGASVKQETLLQIKAEIEGINKSYEERKLKIVKHAKENLSEEVANMIERDIEELNKKKRTRMVSGDFADLIELDADKVIAGIQDQEDAIKKLTNFRENEFYDLDKRDNLYRDNYINAIFNTYGDNTETQELVDIIRDLDIEEFMFGYYDPYSNTQLKDIYDPKQIDEYVEYLSSFYKRQKGITSG